MRDARAGKGQREVAMVWSPPCVVESNVPDQLSRRQKEPVPHPVQRSSRITQSFPQFTTRKKISLSPTEIFHLSRPPQQILSVFTSYVFVPPNNRDRWPVKEYEIVWSGRGERPRTRAGQPPRRKYFLLITSITQQIAEMPRQYFNNVPQRFHNCQLFFFRLDFRRTKKKRTNWNGCWVSSKN